MPRLCERPGCSAPVDVAYGFDAETLVVWLDTFVSDQGARSGVLCRRHADAMVVPLGWMLDDRREPVPRLFTAARMHDLTDGLSRPRARRARPDREARAERADRTLELLRSAAMQLSLEDLGADGSTDGEIRESGPPPIALVTDPTIAMVRPVDEPEVVASEPEPEPEPAATEPEAVESEPESESESEATEPEAVEPEPEPEPAATEPEAVEPEPEPEAVEPEPESGAVEPEAEQPDAQVLPWQPRFDQQDDLSGLLKARGRLLSRAFRGIVADGA